MRGELAVHHLASVPRREEGDGLSSVSSLALSSSRYLSFAGVTQPGRVKKARQLFAHHSELNKTTHVKNIILVLFFFSLEMRLAVLTGKKKPPGISVVVVYK